MASFWASTAGITTQPGTEQHLRWPLTRMATITFIPFASFSRVLRYANSNAQVGDASWASTSVGTAIQ